MDSNPTPQPRYAVVAQALTTDIVEGRHGIGAMLPTEGELSRAFGVSRSTVREALRRLGEQGLVAAAHGVGTRVIADRPRSEYRLAAGSVADVMGYAGPVCLDVASRQEVQASQGLAARLGCEAGTQWWHVGGVRRTHRGGPAFACVDLFIAAEFADVATGEALLSTPAYRLIGESRGLQITEIKQEITAISLDAAQAGLLGGTPGQPGLHIRRRFYAADGRLVEATLNVHGDADCFTYALRLGGFNG